MTYESLLTNPMVQVLGWSLLHFIWQGTLLMMILATVNALVTRSVTPRVSARIRYAASCIVMLLMIVVVVVTVIQGYPFLPEAAVSTQGLQSGPSSLADRISLPLIASPTVGIGLPGWVACFWFAGVLVLSGRAAGGWIRAQLIKRRSCRPVGPELMEAFEMLKRRLRVAGCVRLYGSVLAKAPMVIGWIRPAILLPVSALTGLTEAQLRLIVAHELAHIRRHDYLMNLFQSAVETILFYHPAVWWVSRQLRIEREHCCDDTAVDVCGDVAGYALALARLEELRVESPEPAVAASGGELLSRIRRLLEQEEARHRFPRSMGAVAAAVTVLCFVTMPVMWSLNAAPQQQQESVPSQIPLASAPVAARSPEARPSPVREPEPQAPVRNGEGNGVGNGIGNGFGDGVDADFRRALGEYRRVIAEVQRDLLTMRGEGAVERGPSAQSTELLIKLYDGSQDVEVKRHILDYLGMSSTAQAAEKVNSVARSDTDPELRRHAMDYILGKADAATLISLYDESREPELKRHILDYLGGASSPQASEKLLSIARSDPEPELRRHAIDYIATKPNAFDTLAGLYDSSRDPELKRHILDYLGSSNDPRTLEKLFSIAQSDPDRNLRRMAVDYIAGR